MAYIDYDGCGEREIVATAYTLLIYEQEFKRDMIKDVFGRIDLRKAALNYDKDGNPVVMDYTMDDWNAELRALWALLRTAQELATRKGEKRDAVPSFQKWVMDTGAIDMQLVSNAVVEECQRGFFRAGAAASD